MNFSFLKRWKSQPASVSATSGGTVSATTAVVEDKAGPADDEKTQAGEPSACLEMPWETVLPLLPESVVKNSASAEPNARVRLPLRQILPQLSKGRVVVPLNDLLAQLPAELRASSGPYTGTDKINLPIDQVVAHLSPDALQARSDQRELELEDGEIPVPFAEEAPETDFLSGEDPLILDTPASRAIEPVEPVTPTRERAPVAPASAAESPMTRVPLVEPVAIRDAAPVAAAPAAPASESVRQWIYLKLGNILDSIPADALAADRETIRTRVDGSYQIPVQSDQIIRQLNKGRIELDLGPLASKFPEGVLVADAGGQITLGVDKVIDQLPDSVFSQSTSGDAFGQTLQEIPNPFSEVKRAEESPAPSSDEPVLQARSTEPGAPASPRSVEPISEEDIPQTLFVEPTPPATAPPVVEAAAVSSAPPVEEAQVAAVEPHVDQTLTSEPVAEIVAAVPTEQPALATSVEPRVELSPARELSVEPEAIAPAAQPAVPAPAEPQVELSPAREPVAEPEAAAPTEQPPATVPVEAVAEQDLDDLDSIAVPAEPEPGVSEPPRRRLTPEEIATALNEVNTWTADDFHRHTLGPTLTQRILDYRTQRGGFHNLTELMQIAGIGPRVFEKVLGFNPSALEDEAHAANRLLGVPCDHEMTLQEIVKCASQLPGVEGCIVAMSDGLYMTGELPRQMDSQRVSAFAPQLFGRVSQYVRELNVGTARRLTIFTDAQPITIFKANDLFFIVIHKANRFSKVLLNKCERISQEISRICSKETAKE